MFKYILKRILIFIPTLIVISLITFMISQNAPGDPVEQMLTQTVGGGEGRASDRMATEKVYLQQRQKLGLDLPIFYFSLSNLAEPDTLYKIPKEHHRENLSRLIHIHGNWQQIESYYHQVKKFEYAVYNIPRTESNARALIRMKDITSALSVSYRDERIAAIFSELNDSCAANPSLNTLIPPLNAARSAYDKVKSESTKWKTSVPALNFYGFQNQYHKWITKFFMGDFGISYQDKRPVSSKVWEAIGWTMLLSSLSIFFTYLVAVPIGVWSAVNKGSTADKAVTSGLFILYSLPNFWVATMLIFFLGGGDYLDWFPPHGVMSVSASAPLSEKIPDIAYHLILPLFCWTYASFAFLSRQMRGGMLTVIGQDYIRTAWAKGLSRGKVTWKHAFRNSLLPIITLFASIFPLAISGSIVLEYIFSLPGMGSLSYNAIIARDYPVVYTVIMFSAVLTLIGYLVADILYAAADPRITYSGRK